MPLVVTNNPVPATPSLASPVSDIRDIRPPVEIPSGFEWLWWVLAALTTMVAVFFLWKWWRRRKEDLPASPPLPPHVRAKMKLLEALALIAQPKPFVIAVSD